jgi:hypothetical protein
LDVVGVVSYLAVLLIFCFKDHNNNSNILFHPFNGCKASPDVERLLCIGVLSAPMNKDKVATKNKTNIPVERLFSCWFVVTWNVVCFCISVFLAALKEKRQRCRAAFVSEIRSGKWKGVTAEFIIGHLPYESSGQAVILVYSIS